MRRVHSGSESEAMEENGTREPPFREKQREQMLNIAEGILSAEGLGALQARRVASASSCSVGTLYNVFGSLDDLIIAANARTLAALGQSLELARNSHSDRSVTALLLAMATSYLEFAAANSARWRAVFEHQMLRDRSVPDWYRDQQARLFALVEDVLAQSVGDGDLRRRIARALFSAVHGVVSLALDRKLGQFDHAETEAQVRLIVTAVGDGLNRK